MLGPRQMMREKSEFNELVKAELMAAIPKISGAYPGLLKLAFLDAAYYDLTDYPNATGGANGSIATSEELARPENATAKAMVEVSVTMSEWPFGTPRSWGSRVNLGQWRV